ncbi:MAG: response regulator [Lachnospiraceae bacterium]
MGNEKDLEQELKELKRKLKMAERDIKRLEVTNAMLIGINRTADKRREYTAQELKKAKEMAEAADRAKSNFLASMSHEIRTPINAVLGMNELIIRDSKEKAIVDYALDVRSSGKMLLSLINDILDFSKIESGRMDLIPDKYDLSSTINDIYNMLHPRAEEKELELLVQVDENLPGVLFGDELRVRQIITNLLTNAVKYTDSGKVGLRIYGEKLDLSSFSDDDRMEIMKMASGQEQELKGIVLFCADIIDTGRGIKREDQEKLFSSFTRFDENNNKSIEGTGLGLALTKHYVDMMEGEISVNSFYGVGSTFRVQIPQGIIDDSPIGNWEERIKNAKTRVEEKNIRLFAPQAKVLVVDDVIMNCKVFKGLLKETEIQIDVALSGPEALRKCKYDAYDVIFMDHRMPGMDGIECFHKLREQKNLEGNNPNNETPVIILTANAIAGMREMFLKEGFNDYLTKPVDGKSLIAMVDKYLPLHLKEDPDAPKNMPENAGESDRAELAQRFPHLDTALGMSYCAEVEEFYTEMIYEFNVADKRQILQDCLAQNNLKDYRTHVHAVKSTALTIGAKNLSALAKELEMAATTNNLVFIKDNQETFLQEYENVINGNEKGLSPDWKET